jgi:RHS repeat-associated protein
MPMSVVYTTFAGAVVREDRGGTVRDYGRDALGSTAALYDESGNKTDEFHYWPYGEVRSHVGSSPTPLTFVGTLGYYMDSARRYYVRARVYRADLGRWATKDLLWPMESYYGYGRNQPVRFVDPSGLLNLGLVGKCAGGIGGAALGFVGGLIIGGDLPKPDAKTACQAGSACAGAMLDALVEAALAAACAPCAAELAGCVGGAIGSLANSLGSVLCEGLDPCARSNGEEAGCRAAAAIADAAAACIGGVFPNTGAGGVVGVVRSAVYSAVGGLTGEACGKLGEGGASAPWTARPAVTRTRRPGVV